MISKNCSIEEFVEAVKDKDSYEVIKLAARETDQAERLLLKAKKQPQKKPKCGKKYSKHLKQLIACHRNGIKPKFPRKKVYRLYMRHWGGANK